MLTANFRSPLPTTSLEHVHEHVCEWIFFGVNPLRLDRLNLIELAILVLAVEILQVDGCHTEGKITVS